MKKNEDVEQAQKQDHSELIITDLPNNKSLGNSLIPELTCSITKSIFYEPVTLPCCGQSCEKDIISKLSRNKCPLCQEEIDREKDYPISVSLKNSITIHLSQEKIRYEDIYFCFKRFANDIVEPDLVKKHLQEEKFQAFLLEALTSHDEFTKKGGVIPLHFHFLSLLAKKTQNLTLKKLLDTSLSEEALHKYKLTLNKKIKTETPKNILEFVKLPEGTKLLHDCPYILDFAEPKELETIIDHLVKEKNYASLDLYPRLFIHIFLRFPQLAWRNFVKNASDFIFPLLNTYAGQTWIKQNHGEFTSILNSLSNEQLNSTSITGTPLALYLLFMVECRAWAKEKDNEKILTNILQKQTSATLNTIDQKGENIFLWLLRMPDWVCKHPQDLLDMYTKLSSQTVTKANKNGDSIRKFVSNLSIGKMPGWDNEQHVEFKTKILPKLKIIDKNRTKPPSNPSQQQFRFLGVSVNKENNPGQTEGDRKRKYGDYPPNKKPHTSQ